MNPILIYHMQQTTLLSFHYTHLFSRHRSPPHSVWHLLRPDGLINHLQPILPLLITLWFLSGSRNKQECWMNKENSGVRQIKRWCLGVYVTDHTHWDPLSTARRLHIGVARSACVCVRSHVGPSPGECLLLVQCGVFLNQGEWQLWSYSVFAVKEKTYMYFIRQDKIWCPLRSVLKQWQKFFSIFNEAHIQGRGQAW